MTQRCPETENGVQCILEAGHTTPHRTDWASEPLAAPVAATSPAPSAAPTAPTPAKKGRGISQRQLVVGLIVLVVAAGVFGFVRGRPASAPGAAPAANRNVTGTFVRWEAVDDKRGYAYFTATNHGTETVTAECKVSVRNDFGNFGFDSLVGEQIAPGETLSGRMSISVGDGSQLINQGEVTDC
jgi:hypothetical protein